MDRKILLVEPNYRNKYPPLGLMKLSTYHKKLGDKVTFFKGEFNDFILEDIYSELQMKLYNIDVSVPWEDHKDLILSYIKFGFEKAFLELRKLSSDLFVFENLKFYKDYYKKKKYYSNPKWDRICIATLFTFYWDKTIDTINSFKGLCKSQDEVWIGGVTASVIPDEIKKETGIYPHVGLLDKAGIMDDNNIIIDHEPLDYSILNEIDYKYPESNGYYGYMTRGCINKCSFCAVPTIEKKYIDHIGIKKQIEYVDSHFGKRQNLLLLDNNVLASKKFDTIINEIKDCGFTKDAKFYEPNAYEVALNGLRSGYNDKGYIKCIINLYKALMKKLGKNTQKEAYDLLFQNKLLNINTAKKDNIIKLNDYFMPLFEKYRYKKPKARYVDFNQGVDARLINEKNIAKLAEIPIKPLRIAFDSWKECEIYENAIRLAADSGIQSMSNYLLYNYKDEPIELYKRLKLNVDLCEELNVNIYSFPMKYHPINDSNYFRARTFIGDNWNRKYIRAVQAILNSTKGKIGKGKSFFEEAFGSNQTEFNKLLYMPETFIIYRMLYKGNGVTQRWWEDFNNLDQNRTTEIKNIIHNNDFSDIENLSSDKQIIHVLSYYKISRDEAEKLLEK